MGTDTGTDARERGNGRNNGFYVIIVDDTTVNNILGIDDNYMDHMTVIPATTVLLLYVVANGHTFGPSLFHILRMCSGIKRLILVFSVTDMKVFYPPGCICGQQAHWQTEKLVLNILREVEIIEMGDSEHEVTFMKQLFSWATVLEKLTITFNRSITESKAKVFRQTMLGSFSRPAVCMKFYIWKGLDEMLYVP